MCSQFTQRFSSDRLVKILKATRVDVEAAPTGRVLPYQQATVFHLEDDERALARMQFSLLPRWAAEPRVKFATHNARLDTVDEKASFRDAFVRRHCVVPMSGFVEPIYDGRYAGQMVEFEVEEDILCAAAIWEEWVSKKDGEVIRSFSVITHNPLELVEKTGHDRSPVFLGPESVETWLRSENQSPGDLKHFLAQEHWSPGLKINIDRPMKAGWEKRRHP